MTAVSLPKLTDKAHRSLRELMKTLRMCGDREDAAALEMLLKLHDNVHKLEKTNDS
jgi:hypothetical protein